MTETPNISPPSTRLLRRPAVKERLGVECDASLDNLIAGEGFPRPVRIGKRMVAWPEHEVDAWIAQRIAASRAEQEAKSEAKRRAGRARAKQRAEVPDAA